MTLDPTQNPEEQEERQPANPPLPEPDAPESKPEDKQVPAPEAEGKPEASPEKEPAKGEKALEPAKPRPGWLMEMRSLLRLFLVGLVILLVGALLSMVVFYFPLQQEYDRANQQLGEANQQISDLQAAQAAMVNQQNLLEAELELSQNDLAELQDDLAQRVNHILLARLQADINAARLALALEDTDGAGALLTPLETRLAELGQRLGADYADSLEGLSDRLGLARRSLTSDMDAAQTDLALIAERLAQLEASLFTTP